MHRRYEPTGKQGSVSPVGIQHQNNEGHSAASNNRHQNANSPSRQNIQHTNRTEPHEHDEDFNIHKNPDAKNPHPVTKFIPQSVYNPQTGKILGFLSAEDLLILGLIFLLLDSGDECEDNSMLIYALLYILISDHMDLPF